ncbi:MAG TPA: hypothetical protein VFH61_14725 [Thermoleophilia bacterium]|nr:hypothetical protein [Thermoleophilia bacterium]
MPAPSLRSRYLNVPVERDAAGRALFDIRTPLRFRPIIGLRSVVVQQGDTIFHMADREYGDALMYWAIADFNSIFDVTTEFTSGREIFLPPASYIGDYLSPSDG